MDPQVAAHRLNEISLLLEVRGENPFKARAFATAARTIQGLDEDDISALVRSHEIAKLPGIGAKTLGVLSDLVETGDSAYLDELRETTPDGLVEMLRIPGLGPARIHQLHTGLGIETVAELEAAARDGRLAGLPGFGVKTAAKILSGIAKLRETSGFLLHGVAATEGARVVRALGRIPGVARVELAGSLRRSAEVVRDIDVVVGVEGAVPPVLEAAARIAGVQESGAAGSDSVTLRMINGVRIDVHCVADAELPLALWRATGSREHCDDVLARLERNGWTIRGRQLVGPGGKVDDDPTERDLYRAAGLEWIPVELREHRGEIDAAATGSLPRLIELTDIRGALHCHTKYSDGTTGILEMARAARAKGWTYLGISDHSQAAEYAGGLTRDAVLRQHDEIDRVNQEFDGFRVLKGIEADILADGHLDYGDELLDRFDFVIGSIHARQSMTADQMTRRVLTAMSDPRLTILGHPTGRLLLAREPFAIDLDAVIQTAAETGVALELNCDPHRLDLDWRVLQVCRQRGVTVELGPDAHSPDELDFIDFGIQIARKGWLESGNVLNAGSADDVIRFARQRRSSTAGTHHG
jgi:DNA polymerase (family 10)